MHHRFHGFVVVVCGAFESMAESPALFLLFLGGMILCFGGLSSLRFATGGRFGALG